MLSERGDLRRSSNNHPLPSFQQSNAAQAVNSLGSTLDPSHAFNERMPEQRLPSQNSSRRNSATQNNALFAVAAANAQQQGGKKEKPESKQNPTEEDDRKRGYQPLGNSTAAPRSKYRTFILPAGVFEVEQRYEIREVVGQGAYGIVCSAVDLKTGKMVAVKKIENIFDHRSLAKRTLRELKLVRSFHHENIMSLDRVMRPHSPNFNNLYLVSELMETDLACVIRSPQELTDEHTQFFIYQVLRGLKYLHSANVVHRDLKPRNLLVNSNCDLKICDFGLARLDDPENEDRCAMSQYVATRWYRAPEVILGKKRYGKAVDMWSCGCIVAELIGRKPLFPGRDSFHQITLITSIIGTPPPDPNAGDSKPGDISDFVMQLPKKPKISFRQIFPHASHLACDLMDRLLVFDPDKRITVEEALQHPYLDELHCAEDEPNCQSLDPSEFYFEYLKTTKEDLRVLIHQEVVNHYKEETWEPPANLPQPPTVPTLISKPLTRRKAHRKSF